MFIYSCTCPPSALRDRPLVVAPPPPHTLSTSRPRHIASLISFIIQEICVFYKFMLLVSWLGCEIHLNLKEKI